MVPWPVAESVFGDFSTTQKKKQKMGLQDAEHYQYNFYLNLFSGNKDLIDFVWFLCTQKFLTFTQNHIEKAPAPSYQDFDVQSILSYSKPTHLHITISTITKTTFECLAMHSNALAALQVCLLFHHHFSTFSTFNAQLCNSYALATLSSYLLFHHHF